MEDNKNRIVSNIRKGKYYIVLTNFLASLCLFIAYNYVKSVLFLFAAVVLLTSGVAAFFVFTGIERKYTAVSDRLNKVKEPGDVNA